MNPSHPLSAASRRDFIRASTLGLGGLTCAGAAMAQAPAPATKAKAPRFNNYDDAVLVAGEPPPIASGSFTIVALPDTQKYAKANPEGFLAQTEWLVANRRSRNIACAVHLGDITDNNKPEQWDLAGLTAALERDFTVRLDIKGWMDADPTLEEQGLRKRIVAEVDAAYAQKVAQVGAPAGHPFD